MPHLSVIFYGNSVYFYAILLTDNKTKKTKNQWPNDPFTLYWKSSIYTHSWGVLHLQFTYWSWKSRINIKWKCKLLYYVYYTDSFCGVSVCLVKLRRLTAWWRLLPHATVTAMLMSSSRLVSSTEHTIMNFLSSFLFMEWKCQYIKCQFISASKMSFPQWNCICVNCINWPIMNHIPASHYLYVCIFLLNHRHMLHPVICHNYAEH